MPASISAWAPADRLSRVVRARAPTGNAMGRFMKVFFAPENHRAQPQSVLMPMNMAVMSPCRMKTTGR